MDHKSPYVITEVRTLVGSLTSVFSLAILLFIFYLLFVSTGLNIRTFLFFAGASVLVVLISKVYFEYFRKRKLLSKRQELMMTYALSKKYKYTFDAMGDVSTFTKGAIYGLGERDKSFQNLVTSGDWSYIEYSFGNYSEGNFKHQESTTYYSIMYVELPRILPNVFFDSKAASKQQFSFLFDQKQLHSLEGDFDKYFATYFPKDYTVDSLSFITPEVMEALIAASDYDIEICGNKLYLYGRLTEPEYQLNDMEQKITRLKTKLLNNIVTYRDERLPFHEGRQTVTIDAQKLRRPPNLPAIFTVAAIIIWIIVQLIFSGG